MADGVKAISIPADAERAVEVLYLPSKEDGDVSLDALYEHTNGGPIGMISCGDGSVLWVNDEFLFSAATPTFNAVATQLILSRGLARAIPNGIFGDTILTGGADSWGNTLAVPEEVIYKLADLTIELGYEMIFHASA